MLMKRIIPCLDVRDGRVVKGVRFAGLRDAGDPVALAALYDAQGADELVILDVSATSEARKTAAHTVAAVRDVLTIPLTVGGGVRSVDDAARLLDAGADKVAINSAAVVRPDLISEIAARFGRQCCVLALDASTINNVPTVLTRSGSFQTALAATDWAARAADLGAGEILLTSFDRDGTRSGYDLPLIRAVAASANVSIIASGGADTPEHMLDALRAGADAVLAASIFHDGHTTIATVKHALKALNVDVRP
jgi:imidazole glycerol-phosphate synthase subunit HisF